MGVFLGGDQGPGSVEIKYKVSISLHLNWMSGISVVVSSLQVVLVAHPIPFYDCYRTMKQSSAMLL